MPFPLVQAQAQLQIHAWTPRRAKRAAGRKISPFCPQTLIKTRGFLEKSAREARPENSHIRRHVPRPASG